MSKPHHKLDLWVGEIVEVRSPEEILSTLDETGRLDAMPFMPEMLQSCGKRFRVYKVAHKTCDNIQAWNMRRVKNAVHLTGSRCDGRAHGNCDAGCLIFWHPTWLKRIEPQILLASQETAGCSSAPSSTTNQAAASALPVPKVLERAAQKGRDPSSGEVVYSCQATALREFTSDLPWWNLWHYVLDIRSGNLRRGVGSDSKSERFLETLLSWNEVFRAILIEIFNVFQKIRSGVQYPHIGGSLQTTAAAELHLQPGEFVQVKSKEEIIATLDRGNRNRGLLFDSEMLRYCGGTYRVLRRVHQIVDEKTGKTLRMKSPCIILEGSSCASEYHRLCPRAIYHYWREDWLRRIE